MSTSEPHWDLSDDELTVRLLAHEVPWEAVRLLVAQRDDSDVAQRIGELLR